MSLANLIQILFILLADHTAWSHFQAVSRQVVFSTPTKNQYRLVIDTIWEFLVKHGAPFGHLYCSKCDDPISFKKRADEAKKEYGNDIIMKIQTLHLDGDACKDFLVTGVPKEKRYGHFTIIVYVVP